MDLEITNRKNINEPIDEIEQEKIIEEIKLDYYSMVKFQNISFSILSILSGLICLIIFGKSKDKKESIFLCLPFFFSFFSHILKFNFLWYLTGLLEIISLYFSIFFLNDIKKTIKFGIHIIILILIYLKISSKNFSNKFPLNIQKLEKKKYPFKTL